MSAANMTVSEVQAAKVKLEAEILNALQSFQELTGLPVERLDIAHIPAYRISDLRASRQVVGVTIELKL